MSDEEGRTAMRRWVQRKVSKFRAKCLQGAMDRQQMGLEEDKGPSLDAIFATAPNGEPMFMGELYHF